jgi:hypothetical protein
MPISFTRTASRFLQNISDILEHLQELIYMDMYSKYRGQTPKKRLQQHIYMDMGRYMTIYLSGASSTSG